MGPELCEFFAAESLNTLPGVGGTAEGVEPPDVPNVNVAGAFPVSDFELPVPDAALKEKKGFVAGAGMFPGANDIDLALPVSGAFTPNSVAELTGASFGPDCPRLSVPALPLGLMSEAAGTAPGLPSPWTPNIEEGRLDGAKAGFEEVVTGCVGGTDELIDGPKLNTDFGGLEGVGAAGRLDGVALGGLLDIPKLNFGFCESLTPPVEGTARLELLVDVVVEIEGCGNEKAPRVVAPEPSP